MKKWNAFVQFNGDCCTYYVKTEFDVTDKLYEDIQKAICEKRPLSNCSFYDELLKSAEEAADIVKYLDVEDEVPLREDYESEEEYNEAVEEFDSLYGEDAFSIENINIVDPTDYKQFIDNFIGRTFDCFATGEKYEEDFKFRYEDAEIENYWFSVTFDENGTIEEISDISAEGCEYENVKGSYWDECYPAYSFITEEFEEALNDGRTTNEE